MLLARSAETGWRESGRSCRKRGSVYRDRGPHPSTRRSFRADASSDDPQVRLPGFHVHGPGWIFSSGRISESKPFPRFFSQPYRHHRNVRPDPDFSPALHRRFQDPVRRAGNGRDNRPGRFDLNSAPTARTVSAHSSSMVSNTMGTCAAEPGFLPIPIKSFGWTPIRRNSSPRSVFAGATNRSSIAAWASRTTISSYGCPRVRNFTWISKASVSTGNTPLLISSSFPWTRNMRLLNPMKPKLRHSLFHDLQAGFFLAIRFVRPGI